MLGLDVDLATAVDPKATGDAGVPAGSELLDFCAAAHEATSPGADVVETTRVLDGARSTLDAALGSDAVQEAAATFAVFNGLVRVADGTGIQVDAGVLADSEDFRPALGIDDFAGAANTQTTPVKVDRSSVTDLFA